MSKRHRWGISGDKGYVKCIKCGLEVLESDRKRGGLGPCILGRWNSIGYKELKESPFIECPNCKQEVIDNIFCIYCGHQLHPINYMKSSY